MNENDANLATFLSSLRQHLMCEIKPLAADLDHNPTLLTKSFNSLNTHFLSKIWFESSQKIEFITLVSDLVLEQIAEVSGALAFIAAQFMGACKRLSLSANQELMARAKADIPAMRMTIGVGTSHLKSGSSAVTAHKVNGGFVIDGRAPWVTGHKVFSHILIAARVGANGTLVALLDFARDDIALSRGMEISRPFDLIAMQSTNTVALTLQKCFVPDRNTVTYIPDNSLSPMSATPPLYLFPLGCARAALRLARKACDCSDADIVSHIDAIESELVRCGEEGRRVFGLNDPKTIAAASIHARTWLDSLLMRSIHTALPLVGGSSICRENEMGRLSREAMVYSVSLQTDAIVASKLASLKIQTDLKYTKV